MNKSHIFSGTKICIASLLLAVAGCHKPIPTHPKVDACGLITNEEVQQIQGSPIKDAKPSEQSDGKFRVAQCFYTAETFSKSVSLAVTQSDPASKKPGDPEDFWKHTFGRYEGEVKEEKGDEEKKKSLEQQEEEKGQPPKKIDGVGEAAYWTANRMGGALYVLKNHVFVRVSIGGGPETEQNKIDRAKALAEKIISRL
jgi:hypothetical protein